MHKAVISSANEHQKLGVDYGSDPFNAELEVLK